MFRRSLLLFIFLFLAGIGLWILIHSGAQTVPGPPPGVPLAGSAPRAPAAAGAAEKKAGPPARPSGGEEEPKGRWRGAAKTAVESLAPLVEGGWKSESEKDRSIPLDVVIQRFLDGSSPLKMRCSDAWRLARAGTPEAMAALKEALGDAPSSLKAAIGEALGECKDPQAKDLMLSLLNGGDETGARGAIRGLAASKDPEAVDILSGVMGDQGRPVSLRSEAALELGETSSSKAFEALRAQYTASKDPDVSEAIVEGMGKLPFNQTKEFFTSLLGSGSTPAEERVAALEALGSSSGETAPFLLKYAAEDGDPEARSAAVWALSNLDDPPPSADLFGLLEGETSSAVRKGIYEALSGQDEITLEELKPRVLGESDPGARVAGLDLLASDYRRSGSKELGESFDREFVPELLSGALTGGEEALRIKSVTALEKARTPGALQALAEIEAAGDPKVAEAAQRALKRAGGAR